MGGGGGGEGLEDDGNRGLLNFHLSVGAYLDYCPGRLPAPLKGNPTFLFVFIFTFLSFFQAANLVPTYE